MGASLLIGLPIAVWALILLGYAFVRTPGIASSIVTDLLEHDLTEPIRRAFHRRGVV